MNCEISHFWGCLAICIGIMLSACSNSTSSPAEPTEAIEPNFYSVLTIYSPNGLGDQSYNDNIYRGFRESLKSHENLAVETYNPTGIDDAEAIIQYWMSEKDKPEITKFVKKRLLVLTASTFEEMLNKHPEWRNSGKNDILLLDSRNPDSLDVYTRYIPLYGASHLAGQVIYELGAQKTACVLANPVLEPLTQALEGFSEGFKKAGGTFDSTDAYYLAQDPSEGFNNADSLYKLSYQLDSAGYRFVLPVAGGSSTGLLRYTREFADRNTFYTCGIDIDQQKYSKRVAFSIVKRMDLVVRNFIDDWMTDKILEKNETFGLLDNFAEIVIADEFKNVQVEYAKQREIAAMAEENYLKEH